MAEEVVKRIRIQVDGDQAKKELNDVKDSLKETNKNVKDLEKTNLGNFSQSLGGLKDAFLAGEIGAKGLAKGVLSVGKAMFTAFISNPIGIVIAAIVVPFVILYNLFKSFKPVTDVIERSFAAISAVFSLLKNGLTGLISGNVSLKNTFSGLGTEMSKTAKAAYDLAAAQQALDEANQDLELSNAKVQTQIEQLTIQSKNRTITEKERLALFAQIEKVEKDQYEKRKQIADETERIAFEKMIQGKRVTDEEIKNIKELGLAEARRVLESKGLTDEQIGLWQKALIAQEQIAQQHNAIIDKGIIKQDAAIQKQKDDAQKAKDDSIAAAEKAAAKEKEINDKLFAEAVYYYDEEIKKINTIKDIRDEEYERIKELDNFNSSRIERERRAIFKEIELKGRAYAIEKDGLIKNKATKEEIHKIDKEWINFKTSKEEELGELPIKYAIIKRDLDQKHFLEDKKRKEAEIAQWKDGTVEKLKLQNELNVLIVNNSKNQIEQSENIFNLENDNLSKLRDIDFQNALEGFDNKLDLIKRDEELLSISNINRVENRRDALNKESNEVEIAHTKGLISESEYYKRVNSLIVQSAQVKKELNQQRIDATLETINALSQADQAFTDASINREKNKLQRGEIDQKTYDKKISEIQEKAAKRAKAYAIAETIINTAQAVSKSLTAAPFPFNIALAVGTGLLGVAQLAKILSTPTKQDSGSIASVSGSGSSSSSSSSSSTGTSPNTSFTFEKSASVPATNVSKTYVLTKDVTTASQLDRATIANGSI